MSRPVRGRIQTKDMKAERTEDVKILVCGATGFVGGAITRHLVDAGHQVRAMTRSLDRARQKYDNYGPAREALAQGRLTFVEADVTKPLTLTAAVESVDAVVQTAQFTGAPVQNPSRGLTYAAVDRDGTLNLLGAIAQIYGRPTAGPNLARFPSGSPRFLYMSGISVSAEAREPWNRAKWQAEEAIRSSGLTWTIVRSCWAYGPDDIALNRILGYSDYLPFVPVFGRGQDPLSPVFVEDIGDLFALLLADPEKTVDTTFKLGGPDTVTLNDFLSLALHTMGRRRPILHIPKPVGRAMGTIAQRLPGRPLTPDAVDFISQGGAVTDADRAFLAERVPSFQPTPLQEGLATYLGRAPRHAYH